MVNFNLYILILYFQSIDKKISSYYLLVNYNSKIHAKTHKSLEFNIIKNTNMK